MMLINACSTMLTPQSFCIGPRGSQRSGDDQIIVHTAFLSSAVSEGGSSAQAKRSERAAGSRYKPGDFRLKSPTAPYGKLIDESTPFTV